MRRPDGPSGLLVVDKPVGPTSFDVVSRVKRLLGAATAGHAGTLDPLASGVLTVCLGQAVKLQALLADGDKAYEATVALGAATTTQDREGEVTGRADASGLDEAALRAALPRFEGELLQLPPMFSAVRVGGRRLHEAARAGEEVERTPRRVTVHALDLLALEPPGGELRLARLAVRCGKGTYVRTLAADLGAALGVPAHLAALRRTAAGPFTLSEATTLGELERLAKEGREALLSRLLAPAEGLRDWPRVEVDLSQVRSLGQGKRLVWPGIPEGRCAALDPSGRLVAICRGGAGHLQPVRVLATA